jgi:hypothetical protein
MNNSADMEVVVSEQSYADVAVKVWSTKMRSLGDERLRRLREEVVKAAIEICSERP